MRKTAAIISSILFIVTAGIGAEQSHPVNQLNGIDTRSDAVGLTHFMFEGQSLHNIRTIYMGGTGFAGDPQQEGYIGSSSNNDALFIVGDPAGDTREVRIGQTSDNGVSDLHVSGDIRLDGLIRNTGGSAEVADDWNVNDAVTAKRVSAGEDEEFTMMGYGGNGNRIDFTDTDSNIGEIAVGDYQNSLSNDGNLKVGADLEVLGDAEAQHLRLTGSSDLGEGGRLAGVSYLSNEQGGTLDWCRLAPDGDWECTGSKNFVQDVNSTHEAVYTSQESPDARAVVEGTVELDDGDAVVDLPNHFSSVASSDQPDITAQATPHSLATVAVTERDTESIKIEADTEEVKVDYRVTAVREGYEESEVVRPQRGE
jgi:hypothetical protein